MKLLQILQKCLEDWKNISHLDFCLVNLDNTIYISTCDRALPSEEKLEEFKEDDALCISNMNCRLYKVTESHQLQYVLIVWGNAEAASTIGELAVCQIESLLTAYMEKSDKNVFMQNLLLGSYSEVDAFNRAKKLHIAANARRVVFLVDTAQEKDNASMECIRSLLGTKTGDFITAVDEKSIIVVKELASEEGYQEMEKTAKQILNVLPAEKQEVSHIAYGTIVEEIKEVSRSYKEARMAMDVGRIFFEEKNIIAYSSLGIGRLIYQLPIPLCKMFIKEIFENKSPDDFDEETLVTINKFFENSLNVSETSRQLYIHRNTLVYRLDKLQKSTGLDLRVFEDAITFKIALMVVKYMKYMETLDY